MKTWMLVILIPFSAVISKQAFSLDIAVNGPAATAAIAQSAHVQADTVDPGKEYKRNRLMQVTGYALLGTSAAMILAGAVMVEAAPWGTVSRIGIISVGVGLVHFITAAFLLGFSKVIILQELPPQRPLQIIKKTSFYKTRSSDIYF